MKLRYDLPMYYGASPRLFEFAKNLRLTPTEAERKLWEVLTAEPFKSYKFRRQHAIATFIADFYCHTLKLVIEADGGIHKIKEYEEYDDFRDADMHKLDIMVLRFTNEQILRNTEKVKQVIMNAIEQRLL